MCVVLFILAHLIMGGSVSRVRYSTDEYWVAKDYHHVYEKYSGKIVDTIEDSESCELDGDTIIVTTLKKTFAIGVVLAFLALACILGIVIEYIRLSEWWDVLWHGSSSPYSRRYVDKDKNTDTIDENEEPSEKDDPVDGYQKSEPTPYEKQLIALFKLGAASNQFKGNEVKGDAETEKKLVSKFRVVYLRLLIDGKKRRVEDIMDDEAGAYLVEFCNWLKHSPLIKSFLGIFKLGAFSIFEHSAIIYSFVFPPNSIAYTMALILVLTKRGKLRLFALETGARGSSVLCEYTGYSHRNYGDVEESVALKINAILEDDEK